MGSGLMKPVVEYRIRGRFVSFWPRRDYKHSLDREFVEKSLWDVEEQQAAALESQIFVEEAVAKIRVNDFEKARLPKLCCRRSDLSWLPWIRKGQELTLCDTI